MIILILKCNNSIKIPNQSIWLSAFPSLKGDRIWCNLPGKRTKFLDWETRVNVNFKNFQTILHITKYWFNKVLNWKKIFPSVLTRNSNFTIFLKVLVLFSTSTLRRLGSYFSVFYIYKIISWLRRFWKETPVAGFPKSLSPGLGGMESGWRASQWRRSVSRQPGTVEQPEAAETMANTGRDPLKGSLQKYTECVLILSLKKTHTRTV